MNIDNKQKEIDDKLSEKIYNLIEHKDLMVFIHVHKKGQFTKDDINEIVNNVKNAVSNLSIIEKIKKNEKYLYEMNNLCNKSFDVHLTKLDKNYKNDKIQYIQFSSNHRLHKR